MLITIGPQSKRYPKIYVNITLFPREVTHILKLLNLPAIQKDAKPEVRLKVKVVEDHIKIYLDDTGGKVNFYEKASGGFAGRLTQAIAGTGLAHQNISSTEIFDVTLDSEGVLGKIPPEILYSPKKEIEKPKDLDSRLLDSYLSYGSSLRQLIAVVKEAREIGRDVSISMPNEVGEITMTIDGVEVSE